MAAVASITRWKDPVLITSDRTGKDSNCPSPEARSPDKLIELRDCVGGETPGQNQKQLTEPQTLPATNQVSQKLRSALAKGSTQPCQLYHCVPPSLCGMHPTMGTLCYLASSSLLCLRFGAEIPLDTHTHISMWGFPTCVFRL